MTTSSHEQPRRNAARPAVLALLCALALGALAPAGDTARPRQEPGQRVPEQVRQQYAWLFEPDFAELGLARLLPESHDPPDKLREPFRAGDTITLRLLITNASEEGKPIIVGQPFSHQRPELSKHGEPLPYSPQAAQHAAAGDRYFSLDGYKFSPLGPKETYTEIVNLGDWYERLEPGDYRLVVRRRFIWGGRWLTSPPLAFKVIE
jgi:hypothetical protein